MPFLQYSEGNEVSTVGLYDKEKSFNIKWYIFNPGRPTAELFVFFSHLKLEWQFIASNE